MGRQPETAAPHPGNAGGLKYRDTRFESPARDQARSGLETRFGWQRCDRQGALRERVGLPPRVPEIRLESAGSPRDPGFAFTVLAVPGVFEPLDPEETARRIGAGLGATGSYGT